MYRKRTAAAAATLLAALLALGLVFQPHVSAAPVRWFGRHSFWNTPVVGVPRIDRHSATMIASLQSYSSTAQLVNDPEYGIPIAFASRTDPLYRIRSSVYRAGAASVRCRVPDGATPSLGTDRHLTIVQPDGRACDFWQFAAPAGKRPRAATVGSPCGLVYGIAATAWGTIPCPTKLGNGATASGFALAGGLIRSREMRSAAPLGHALALSLPSAIVRAGPPAWPATHSDGHCPVMAACLPEGAHIQLDPRFNVASAHWPRWKRRIARALQVYGAFVADQGGSLAVRAQDTGSGRSWAAQGIPLDPSLASLPWGSMRVLSIRPNRRATAATHRARRHRR